MKDQAKTRNQLIDKLRELRRRISKLEKSDTISKHIKERFKKSEEKYRLLVETSTDMIFTVDVKGNFLFVNRAFKKNLGYSIEEIKKINGFKLVHPEDLPTVGKQFGQLLKGKSVDNMEYRYKTKDGSYIHILNNATPIFDSKGNVVSAFGVARDITLRKRMEDELRKAHEELERRVKMRTHELLAANEQLKEEITERKRAEEALRESEEKLRVLFERTYDLITLTDADATALWANPAWKNLFGKDLTRRKDPFKFIHPDDLDEVAQAWNMLVTKGEAIRDLVYRFKGDDGVYRVFESCTYPVTIGGKKQFYVVSRDITERKKVEEEKERLQAQLIQSEKMAGIGTLTSGIAHEFNNMLQIMSGHTEFAQRTKKPEDMEEALEIVGNTSDRVSKIIKDLLTFSRREQLERKICHIAELVEFVLSMTEEQLKKHNIEVMREYRKTPNIEVNKGELQQVFLNMVTNARDAMLPKGGRLVIKVKKAKDNVEISFTDTGIGIEEENLSRVFEPFYTTKGAVGGDTRTQGIGLGLSVSYGIVERHGGTIEVESEAGKGTTFTIRLPAKVEKAEKRIVKEKRKVKAEKTTPMNVLVVDDEEEICKMITKWLSAEGHKVKSALTGEKALQQVKKEQFDVVFLDVIMPGVPILIVLEKIKRISQSTKVVMITGRMLDKEFKKELKGKGAPGFIQKPFKLEDILEFLK